jgi:hypothetical protein
LNFELYEEEHRDNQFQHTGAHGVLHPFHQETGVRLADNGV